MGQSKDDQSFSFNFGKFFDELFNKDIPEWGSHIRTNFNMLFPAINVKETASAFELELAAPGRQKSDFSIKFKDGRLNVTVGKKEAPQLKEGEKYLKKEFGHPEIRRHFNFPKYSVDETAIKARYQNGVLKVTLQKRVETKTDDSTQIKVD